MSSKSVSLNRHLVKESFILLNAISHKSFLSEEPTQPTHELTYLAVAEGYVSLELKVVEGEIVDVRHSQLTAKGKQSEESSKEDPWYKDFKIVDAKGNLLLPGFVNAHTHSLEHFARGKILPCPLELWLADLIDFSPTSPYLFYLAALFAALETLYSGGTTILDHVVPSLGFEEQCLDEVVRAYKDIGIRAIVAPLLDDQTVECTMPFLEGEQVDRAFDKQQSEKDNKDSNEKVQKQPVKKMLEVAKKRRECSSPGYRDTERGLEIWENIIRKHHGKDDLIVMAIGPTGIQKCSDKLFHGCVKLSNKYGIPRHVHLLETETQSILSYQKYGMTGVSFLDSVGFLDDKTTCAHSIWLEENDFDILSKRGSTIVHNPLSNLRLGSGICSIKNCEKYGVNVAVGCDGAASNDSQNLLEAVKMACILHSPADKDYRRWHSPVKCVKWASFGGAKGIGMSKKLGTLTAGKRADLVLYDLDSLSLLPRTDPISQLVYGSHGQSVIDSVWVDGKQIVKEKKILTIDEELLKKEIIENSKFIWEEADKLKDMNLRQLIEGKYRQVWNL